MRGREPREREARMEEARGLAIAIGLSVVDVQLFPVRQPRAATLLGEGQILAIAAACEQFQADLVVVDGSLTAIQQRNLEEKLRRKVIDRTGLILEIFGERAVTAEGRLQVELAHLDYQAGRLVRSWTHLERQRGGFGFLGGPGETQIEADRRLIRDRWPSCGANWSRCGARGACIAIGGEGALAGDCLGRLHQRWQVDIVQPAYGCRGGRAGLAVRDSGSNHAGNSLARRGQGHPVRHRRIHLGPSDPARRRISGDFGGSDCGRLHSPRARHCQRRERRSKVRGVENPCRSGTGRSA